MVNIVSIKDGKPKQHENRIFSKFLVVFIFIFFITPMRFHYNKSRLQYCDIVRCSLLSILPYSLVNEEKLTTTNNVYPSNYAASKFLLMYSVTQLIGMCCHSSLLTFSIALKSCELCTASCKK